ncbi:hypothetical protein FRC00_006487 [Tulasnella sp. 408]|nr:hypothetical protein FRC00_006487 [Tulasnella sp. 408]
MGRRIKKLRLRLGQAEPRSPPSQDDVPMAVDEVGTSVPIRGSSSPGHPSSPPAAAGSATSHDHQENYAQAGERCPSPINVDPEPESPVVGSQANDHEEAAGASEESLSERGPPAPNEEEENIIPIEQPVDEGDELDSDDEPLDLPRGSPPAVHGPSQENNGDHHAATADQEAESSDDGSDFSDAVHEAKASKYSSSNANAAAEIEKELEETSDPEIRPQAPVERRAPRVSASSAEFGLPGSVGPRAGPSTSPTARLESLSSAFSSHTISGSRTVGGSAEASPAGGEPAHDEESEDI